MAVEHVHIGFDSGWNYMVFGEDGLGMFTFHYVTYKIHKNMLQKVRQRLRYIKDGDQTEKAVQSSVLIMYLRLQIDHGTVMNKLSVLQWANE